jgi:hypothetical protein
MWINKDGNENSSPALKDYLPRSSQGCIIFTTRSRKIAVKLAQHNKVAHWFTVIGKELNDPAIFRENVYNMDETEVLLSILSSLKILIEKDGLTFRRAGIKRTLIIAIEYIFIDGKSLYPLII